MPKAVRWKPAKDHPWRFKGVKDPEAGAEESTIERAADYRWGEMEIRAHFDSNEMGGRFNG